MTKVRKSTPVTIPIKINKWRVEYSVNAGVEEFLKGAFSLVISDVIFLN